MSAILVLRIILGFRMRTPRYEFGVSSGRSVQRRKFCGGYSVHCVVMMDCVVRDVGVRLDEF